MSALTSAFACPLGASGRYGMTPAQQRIYLAAVDVHQRMGGHVRIIDVAQDTGELRSLVHQYLSQLIERGWVVKAGREYRLTNPVMRFRPTRKGQ